MSTRAKSRRAERSRVLVLGRCAAVLACGSVYAASAEVAESQWLSPASGDWTDALKWSTNPFYPRNSVPAGMGYAVLISAGGSDYTVLLNPDADLTVDGLMLDSSNAVVHQQARVLEVLGDFDIRSGVWRMAAGATGATGGVRAETIRVGGQLLFESGSGFIETTVGALTVDAAGILHGRASALVGHNSRALVNQGLISAGAGGRLILLGNTITNTGTIEARDGGEVSVAGTLDNVSGATLTGGTWAVYDNSHLYLPMISHNAARIVLSGPNSSFTAINGLASNSGSLSIIDGRTYSAGSLFASTGSLTIGAGSTFIAGFGFTQAGGTIGGSGLLRITGGSAAISGAQEWLAGGQINVSGGQLDLDSDAGANLALIIGSKGKARFNVSQHLSKLTVAGTTSLAAGGDKAIVVDDLDMLPGGSLDLSDNMLVVRFASQTPEAALAEVTAFVRAGYKSESDRWTGAGITSLAARDNPFRGLAVVVNDRGDGTKFIPAYAADSVLVKYSLNGDMNLDGVVNALDYFQIDSGFLAGAQGYANGDLNYDGTVNALDYFLIDSAFLGQGSPASGGSTAILWDEELPEPGLAGLAAGIAVVVLRRRRGS